MNTVLYGQKTLLIPLTVRDLEDMLKDTAIVRERYRLSGQLDPPDAHMRKIYHIKLFKMKEKPGKSIYSTYFLIVAGDTKEILGTIGFKGEPDENGTLEVGYGIQKAYRSRGFMTDALMTFIAFGFTLEGVGSVVACTSKGNQASQRVLEKVGFKKVYHADELFVWRYPKKVNMTKVCLVAESESCGSALELSNRHY